MYKQYHVLSSWSLQRSQVTYFLSVYNHCAQLCPPLKTSTGTIIHHWWAAWAQCIACLSGLHNASSHSIHTNRPCPKPHSKLFSRPSPGATSTIGRLASTNQILHFTFSRPHLQLIVDYSFWGLHLFIVLQCLLPLKSFVLESLWLGWERQR